MHNGHMDDSIWREERLAGAEPEAERELSQRIGASEMFAKASQLKKILFYIVEQTLNNALPIKEQDIATEALGRRADFDGTDDNIVRVQVGHLRRRLEQYFATEGRDEEIVLSIPKGSYVALFERREKRPKGDTVVSTTAVQPNKHMPQNLRRLVIGLSLALAGSLVIIGILIYQNSRILTPAAARTNDPPIRENLMIHRIFSGRAPVTVVLLDANVSILNEFYPNVITLEQYRAANYPDNLLASHDPQTVKLLRGIVWSRFTSFGGAEIALQCERQAVLHGNSITLRYSRYISARDLEHGNFILVGPRESNLWESLFEPELNFVLKQNPSVVKWQFQNRMPRPSESAFYSPGQPTSGTNQIPGDYVDYAQIALMPNLSGDGWVLMLNGLTMAGNEAAAHFLLSEESVNTIDKLVASHLNNQTGSPLEILLRIKVIQGSPGNIEVIAAR
jgi:hypothetical protein